MLGMVKMTRDGAQGDQNRYTCSIEAWNLMLEVGKAFGWKPLGATYVPDHVRAVTPVSTRHGYKPGDPRDYKRIDEDDARAWARALSEARRSPHLANMLGVRGENAADPAVPSADTDASFATVMDEFIEYAFGGGFTFALAE